MTSEIIDSIWFDTCRETLSAPALVAEINADLLVIGGGYTGLSAALHAAMSGASTVLIEARSFGSGGSGRNVGLANAGMWLRPDDIDSVLGAETGRHLSDILAGAPDAVYGLIERFGIDCEPVRNGTLHCAHAASGMGDLENRYRQMRARGAPVELLDCESARKRTGSESIHGALFDPRAGTIQPLAYAVGLARAAAQEGAALFENTPATGIEKRDAHWIVDTPSGRIKAGKLIVATNAYSVPIDGFEAPDIIPVHYFQAATQPLSEKHQTQILPGLEGCWDTATVMSSWRLDQQGRLIIGGMGQLGHIGQGAHLAWLKRKAARLFPELPELKPQKTWFGRIAMTSEHLPKILQPDATALMCFGYSGRGIGPGTIFGKAMAEALVNDDLSRLPVPTCRNHTIPFAGLRGAYYETGATLVHLVKDRI